MIQTFYAYFMGFNAIGSYALGLFVLLRRPDNVLFKTWFFFCCGVGTWSLGYFLTMLANVPKDMALLCSRISHASGALIPALFLGYVSTWLGIKNSLGFLLRICYGLCGFFAIFSLTPIIVIDLVPKLSFNFYPVGRIGYLFYVINFISWVLIAHYYMFKNYNTMSGYKRNQMKYFLVGTSLGYFGGASCFPLIFDIKIAPYPSILIFVYIVTTTYAILKYHLMDIRLALTRASIFVLVYTVVLGIPFALGIWLRPWLSAVWGINWWIAPLGLMAIFATVGPFIYIYLNKRAEDRLLKEQKRYHDTLEKASLGMTRIRELTKLMKLIVHVVAKSVRLNFASIYILDNENALYKLGAQKNQSNALVSEISAASSLINWLAQNKDALVFEEIKRQMRDNAAEELEDLRSQMLSIDASVIIPSFIGDKLLAFMVLGEKRSGEIYSKDDLRVFTVLANQAALAIENARFFEEAKEMQEQIAQAEKMATIGTMADGLSHQINNRFHALSMIAGDTLDTIKLTDIAAYTPEQKELIGQIQHSLERMQANVVQGGEVVKGMLKYTRKQDVGFSAVMLDNILDAALEMVQYKIKLSQIDIVRDYPKTIQAVLGNLIQLQEVFFNLIDNAYDAMMERKDTLKEEGYRGKIRIYTESRNNGFLTIHIEDNGIGVKPEDFKKMFTPFFTTKVSSRRGTGLGLYVIKKIIASNHGGTINVSSTYTQGTQFTIELPVHN